MPTAFEKLEKFLRLEKSQGFHNRAVIGGFDGFAEFWRNEALRETQDPSKIIQIHEMTDLLLGYGEADAAGRSQAVDQLLAKLTKGAQEPQEPQGSPEPQGSQEPQEPQGSEEPQEPQARQETAPRQPPLQKPGAVPQTKPAPVPEPPATPAPSAEPAAAPAERPSTGLDALVTTLPGVSTAYTARLRRLGIETVGDLLYHFPHRYDDYSSLKPIDQLEYGDETTVIGTIWETGSRKTRGGKQIITSVVADASGTIEAVWFNQPYLVRQLRAGRRIVLSGKVDEYLGRLLFQSPVWEPLERELIHTARLVPIYPLTRGVTSRWLRRLLKRVVDHWTPRLKDHLPEAVRQRANLPLLSEAIRQIHFPDSEEAAKEARRRLSFDEFFFIQLGMLRQRQEWQSQAAEPVETDPALRDAFVRSLPFELTAAQRRCIDQILSDMAQPRPMSRLLQGDVGSGKTVVATAGMLMAVAAGRQAALMAPTEILAEQHYQTISAALADPAALGLDRPVTVVLLTGGLRRMERKEVYTSLASGEADIVVGTHALIQKHVTFRDLALAVVDEQHRFGVEQRGTLRSKGDSPHLLVMSATPIPRSLALTVYGDLDLSVIDELPPGRDEIETRWLLPRERERAYAFLRSQIEAGRQAFVLYPLVEESEKVEARAATEEYERLQRDVFPDLRLELMHGRLKSKEKDAIMASLREGEIDILVSTSVIEVGIDVPNATVMLIEGADRFGLAQLHQFRGRVGRGEHRSYCLLLSDAVSPEDPQTRTTWERLRAIEDTQDGFVLAEKDLELRGPGDFFGVRQSGLPALRLASLSNVAILEQARAEAQALFREDPLLSKPTHALLREQVSRFWQKAGDLS